jgi:cytochrome c oxidase subunit 2
MSLKQIKMFCICYLIIQTTCDLVAWDLVGCCWVSDAASSYQLSLQDPATPNMENIFLFNFHLLFVIIAIVIVVVWLIYSILFNFTEFKQSSVSNFVHSNTIEIVWTTLPALILLSLASPSFSLLYSLDEISNPSLTFKILGHQWYWSYESSDFISCSDTNIILKYSSYMLTKDFSIETNCLDFFRSLETNKKIILPTDTHLRLLVNAVDVLHSWTIPFFGIKIDACPGRLNQGNLFIKRFGLFYGQCSEICGVNHGFMPTVFLALPSCQYSHLCMEEDLANVMAFSPCPVSHKACPSNSIWIDSEKSCQKLPVLDHRTKLFWCLYGCYGVTCIVLMLYFIDHDPFRGIY